MGAMLEFEVDFSVKIIQHVEVLNWQTFNC